jgi:hypothetical protein
LAFLPSQLEIAPSTFVTVRHVVTGRTTNKTTRSQNSVFHPLTNIHLDRHAEMR